MTLVIAQRIGKKSVSLSSDSRVSWQNAGFIDYGIKVFSVPLKIFAPGKGKKFHVKLEYNYKLGLAVAGNAFSAYTIKESIYEILQHLQYIPGYTDISMDSVTRLVSKVFDKLTIEMGGILREHGICELVLCGYCPKENKIRVFEYTCDISTIPITPSCNEILKSSGIEFYGSGKREAKSVYNTNKSLGPLHLIKEVITQNRVKSVGGGLQYGEFEGNNFNIFGIADHKLDASGNFEKHLYTLRGLNMYQDEFERDEKDFHLAYRYKQPFKAEIDQLFFKK